MSFNEIKVGIMVILSIALMLTLTLMVGNFRSLLSDTIEIRILVPNVKGLNDYAPVTYSGYQIGTTVGRGYDYEKDMPYVVARIDYESPVSTDSVARLTAATMLSPLFIDINGGTPEKRITTLVDQGELEPGEITIEAQPYYTIDDMFALADDAKSVLGKVETILDDIRGPIRQVGDVISNVSEELNVVIADVRGMVQDGRPLIHSTLSNLDGMVKNASQSVNPVLANLESAVNEIPPMIEETRARFNQLLTSANTMVDEISPKVVEIVDELKATVTDLRGRISNIETNLVKLLNDADAMIVENREDIDLMIERLERTTKNLDDLSAQLAKDPWRVIWKTEGRKDPPKVSPDWDPLSDSQ